jgi:hypothetical protein
MVRAAAQAMHLLAYRYVVPVTLCHPGDRISAGTVNNGTASIIRREGRPYALTAGHVVDYYEQRLRSGEEVEFRLAGLLVKLAERLEWQDRTADVAVIRLSEREAVDLGVFISDGLDFSSVDVPAEDSYILSAGFPVYLREDSTNSITYGAQAMALRVTHTGGDYFYCQFEREQWIDMFGRGIPTPGTPLGGLSGAPVFSVGKLHYPFIGIIIEFQPTYELLRVRSLRSLASWALGYSRE